LKHPVLAVALLVHEGFVKLSIINPPQIATIEQSLQAFKLFADSSWFSWG
jgi:hypothetical protein